MSPRVFASTGGSFSAPVFDGLFVFVAMLGTVRIPDASPKPPWNRGAAGSEILPAMYLAGRAAAR